MAESIVGPGAWKEEEGEKFEVPNADAVLLYIHGNPPAEVAEAVRASRTKIVISLEDDCTTCKELEKGPAEALIEARRYVIYGGDENIRGLAQYIAWLLGVAERPRPPTLYVPLQGVYDGAAISELRPLKADVILLVDREDVLYGEWIDAFLEGLRARGLRALAVYSSENLKYRYEGGALAGLSLKSVAEVLAHIDADVIVSLVFPPLLTPEALRRKNAVVLSPVRLVARSLEEWLNDKYGADPFSFAWYVLLPEAGGLVEQIVAGSHRGGEGVRTRLKLYRPHVDYIARRVERWASLRRKRPEERRIAFVFINGNPCDDDREVSFGRAGELDVLESAAFLLKRLREAGYDVRDAPESGEALAKLAVERGAMGPSPWASSEDIVARGGALGFVSLDQYLEWFNELPEPVREKMVADWGRPEEFFSKEGGPIYGGRAVISGLQFGKVIVVMEPSPLIIPGRDMRYCNADYWKAAHDSPVSPNHYYFAFHRWLTRVFKADTVLTFGTHALLEFRPGKSVGLSPFCWPEILIDDVPHPYIYMVSNPGEGLVARRRSWGVMIDHLDWPLKSAEDAAPELSDLLAQYLKARQVDDVQRAEAIFRKISKMAEARGVQLEGDMDSAVYKIASYLDAVKSTSFEGGLHIFGNPPADPDALAQWVAAIMSKDTLHFKSIRRAVAEALGLDYDKIIEENNLNKINSINILNKLGKISEELIKIALVKGVDEALEALGLLAEKYGVA